MSEELRHMRRAGKTFYFASLMLDGSVRRDVAVAYSFCRTVDDIADDNPPSEQRTAALREIAAALRARDVEHPISGGMVALLDRFPEIETPVLDLVAACEADVPGLVIRDDAELVSYAHGVAGNVGLLM
jgi:phytoene/squalene synthetase